MREFLRDAMDVAEVGGVLRGQLPDLVEVVQETDTAINFDNTIFKTVLEGV